MKINWGLIAGIAVVASLVQAGLCGIGLQGALVSVAITLGQIAGALIYAIAQTWAEDISKNGFNHPA